MAGQSPSSSFSYGFSFDVFISFRGADTRSGFTGNLYKALCDKGIHTFIDDKELQKGEKIIPSLHKNIEDSRIAIIVFSKDYASSSFCLDELVHIIHCYKTKGILVLPVFFGVDPTDVRNQSGIFAEHLSNHEERFQNNKKNMDRWHQWKMALAEAANLSGYHYSPPGYEYKFIEKIVKDISNKTNRDFLHVAKYPIGLQSRVQQVKLLLDKQSVDDVHMVGLYWAGGIGKSTLAKAIYNFIADQFEELCFLENVRENSTLNNLKHLQEKLLLKTVRSDIKLGAVSEGITIIKKKLRRKKILLILDDVDKLEQLEALAGGLDWFGRGSRVIITTRDKHLLTCHGIESNYVVEGIYGEEALQLLRLMAFKNGEVFSSYKDILTRALTYASGLPLAIVIIGSNLFGRSVEDWERTLDEYEKIPNKEIQRILRVSYDALEEKDKSIFLDIACCFKGCKWREVKEILHAHYGHCVKYHVEVLAEKSLIDHWEYDVTLHDLIEDMGKEIVREESIKEPGERSRLWYHNDIIDILKNNKGTGNIEMIYLNCPSTEDVINWNGKAFENMTNLKTLIIKNGNFSRGPEYLPSSLRFWEWKGCPLKSLSSCISNKEFNYMEVLSLDNCQYLNHIPNVSGFPNLKKFSFQNCKNLITIHNSIGNLNKLETLNVTGCNKLESFPPLRLPSLKKLKLSCCERLKSFPELLCKMTNIKKIWLYYTSIGELPFSFQNLSELRDFEMRGGGNVMVRFPEHNDKMYSTVFSNLKDLYLDNCKLSDECLPILLKWCVNVTSLHLSFNNFKILPECLSECHYLEDIFLDHCKSLEEIRGIPPNLNYLDAMGCGSLSSSSRRLLLSQKLKEVGCTKIRFPNGTDGIGIPDWFEHQIEGDTISFGFRKKFPIIICILLISKIQRGYIEANLVVNDYNGTLTDFGLRPEYVYMFDLKFNNLMKFVCDKAILNNERIHVEINLKVVDYSFIPKVSIRKLKYSAEMGIHVLKEKNNKEEDVIFTDPYIRKIKLVDYLNASLSQKKRKQNKFSILMGFQRKMWVQQKESP